MKISTKPSINLLTVSYGWNRTKELDSYKTKGHFSFFLLEAMSRTALPSFTYQGRKHYLQKEKKWYGEFRVAVKRVYAKHGTEIRRGLKQTTCKEEKDFPKQLRVLLKTFGPYKPPCANVVLCPNRFGVPGEGYGPLIGRTAYAIFTPNPKEDQTWLMIHEVCHSLLLPVFQSSRVKRLIRQTEPLLKTWTTKKFRTYYPKWEWVIEEYFIHAIEQYVTGSSVKEKLGWGMNRLPWFMKSWKTFQIKRKINPDLCIDAWIIETLVYLERKIEGR